MSEASFEELRGLVEAGVAQRRVPGLAIGLLHNDQQHTAGFGITNIENPLPVDGDTLFQIGSITKTFTATAVLRLVDEGRLDLDQPVRTYVPELRLKDPQAAASVTARHLLTHTGGWIGDHFSDTGRGDDALARYIAELADLEQLTPPGLVYSYSNSGFSLLGRVVEVLTGQTFEAAVQRLVLRPLGLDNSFLFPEDVMTRRFAVGHLGIRVGQPRVLRPWVLPRASTPAGGIAASARELLEYARFHLGDGRAPNGERVLDSATLAAMRQPLVPSTGLPDRAVGLAWNIGRQHIDHAGGTYGQRALLVIWPDDNLAFSALTNAPIGDEVIMEASRWVWRRLLAVPRPETPVISVDASVLDTCVGHYCAPTREVEVGRLGDALVLREISKGGFPTRDTPPPPGPPPPLVRCGFYAEDRLVGLDPPFTELRAEVVRDVDGSVAWLRYAGRLHRRQR